MGSTVLQFLITLVLGVLGALGGIVLLHKFANSLWRKWRRPRSFVGNTSAKFLAIGSSSDGREVRISDNKALAAIREALRLNTIPATCRTANEVNFGARHSSPLLIIGSPRLNAVADDLQRRIAMPFEFVSLTPELAPAPAVLCIYESAGQEYVCSADPSLGEIERRSRPPSMSGLEYDYGILLVGQLSDSETDNQRVLWIGGIHGIGTLGVVKWTLEHLADYDWDEIGNACFLIRVGFHLPPGEPLLPGRPYENLENAEPELLRGPSKWQPRQPPGSPHSPVGILCDMGSVLLPFHRRRFEHNLRHLMGIEALSEEQSEEIKHLQEDFEGGVLDVGHFITEMRRILSRTANDDDAIKLAWKDIFWRNEREILLLSRYRKKDLVRLVLISNTDPLRLEHALGRLDLGSLFDRQHVVASFDRGVRPKGTDSSMLTRGLSILQGELPRSRFVTVFIDDVREYLIEPQDHGINHLHYRTFSQFVYHLRRYGLYDSMSAAL